MNTLVTGGAGFIGSNIVKQLIADEHEVTVLDNLSSGYGSNLDPFPQARFVEGDVRDEAAVADAIENVEVVFHLAASVGNKRSIDFPIQDAETNVIGTLRVLEAARKAGVRKIVVSSSAGIFGELKTLPIREDHPIEPDSPYGCTKLCEEKECLAYAKLYDLEAVCLRYFNVYGPNQRFDAYGNVIPIFVFKMLRGEPLTVFGDGEQTRDFINVRDVVQANLRAATAQRGVGRIQPRQRRPDYHQSTARLPEGPKRPRSRRAARAASPGRRAAQPGRHYGGPLRARLRTRGRDGRGIGRIRHLGS